MGPGSRRAWVLAARLPTLPAAVAPVAVGTACAFSVDRFRAGPAVAALIGALAIQVGTNFANDLFDYLKGADNESRLGPPRAVQLGLIRPSGMRRGMIGAFGVATLAGLYLTWAAGPVVVLIGIASIIAAIAYTAGPFPLGYNGLGDLFVLVFFGFVAVCGTAYVQAGYVPAVAWWSALAMGALATAILVVNNLRDLETDAGAGKRTLAVRWGRRFALGEYLLLLTAAYLVPVVLLHQGMAGTWVLLPLLTVPFALSLARKVLSTTGPAMNPLLFETARVELVFALLLSGGLVLGA
ncbi:MAG: 1,4-dihydroxy-2-naphthoate polyprenyltransferase [Gemmatimonadales bacterium]